MTDQPDLPVSTATPLRIILPPSEPTQQQLVLYNPPKKKKRTKLVRVDSPSSKTLTRPRKPDPSAPKITRPCTECGKKFWSWKALFGHMRCHPERQWRGINPPENLRRPYSGQPAGIPAGGGVVMTAEDHEVAACLLLLANGPSPLNENDNVNVVNINVDNVNAKQGFNCDEEISPNGVGFECSSCKKVFGSHQALGGHRASHKNVKGCFAINNKGGGDVAEGGGGEEEEREREMATMGLGHKCGICMRVFSSGQALGGHKRCHFEKGGLNCFDLNLPAPVEDYNEFSDPFACFSSGLALDLRLGI